MNKTFNDPNKPDVATGKLAATAGAPRLVRKRDVALANAVSVRTVDNWLRNGCPAMKLSSRMTRFDLVEVNEWLKTRFRVRRLGPANKGESK